MKENNMFEYAEPATYVLNMPNPKQIDSVTQNVPKKKRSSKSIATT